MIFVVAGLTALLLMVIYSCLMVAKAADENTTKIMHRRKGGRFIQQEKVPHENPERVCFDHPIYLKRKDCEVCLKTGVSEK